MYFFLEVESFISIVESNVVLRQLDRLFSYITMNWRGKPLTSYEVIVNLIAATTTSKGLKVKCMLDKNEYQKGIKITKEEVEESGIFPDEFHGEWNYTFKPKKEGNAGFIL